jgi:hypothetical protein
LQRRTKHLAQPERDKDSLLESCTGFLPEALDDLSDQKNYIERIE